LNQLYQAAGVSKQAVAQHNGRQQSFNRQASCLVQAVEKLRAEQPGCGVEKMYYQLKPSFIGRDRFIDLMMDIGFRLRRPRNGRRTTYKGDKWYPNLIKGMKVSESCTIWQSDITYIQTGEQCYYAVFIIDVYSKVIVGYEVSRTLRATANVKALAMALQHHKAPAIHHSDRGTQYGCERYCKALTDRGIAISMATKAPDNAYAERINLTIKEEYLYHWEPQTFEQLKRQMKKAVNNYNRKRPHNHLARMSPVEFEKKLQDPTYRRPIITIFDDSKYLKPVNLF
jgi:putative transposase